MNKRVTVGQLLATLERVDPNRPVCFETRNGAFFAPQGLAVDEVDYDEVVGESGEWEIVIPIVREED